MRRKITQAHLVLIVTFALYMGYQWMMQWIPVHNVMFHVMMGQVMLIFPSAMWMIGCYRKNKSQLMERMLFVPLSNANIKMAVAVIISAYPVVTILNSFSMFFVENQVMTVMPYMMRMGLFPMFFSMAVMPAFNEELLFRGVLYGAYRRQSKKTGILFSALTFGLMHLNLNQMLYAIYLGIVLALMVEATGSIYTSMLMHFLLNGFNVVMNYMAARMLAAEEIGGSQIQQAADTTVQTFAGIPFQQLITMLIVLAIFLFFFLILIYSTFRMNKRNLQNEEGKGRIIDILIVIFIIITVILTYMNTEFL